MKRFFFSAAPATYGSFQARDGIWAADVTYATAAAMPDSRQKQYQIPNPQHHGGNSKIFEIVVTVHNIVNVINGNEL